jgi:molecular chaperone HtpG
MFGNLPESYNLVVDTNHPLVNKVFEEMKKKTEARTSKIMEKIEPLKKTKEDLEKANKDKKEEEIPQADKDRIAELEKKIEELEQKKKEILHAYAEKSKLVRQLIDLALLSNNMLRGEKLNTFVKRSIELL